MLLIMLVISLEYKVFFLDISFCSIILKKYLFQVEHIFLEELMVLDVEGDKHIQGNYLVIQLAF